MAEIALAFRSLGRIFDPACFSIPWATEGYAQSPQALVLRDRVRVYFSTRSRDESGKFLSHVAFADFDHGFNRVIEVSPRPVIGLGGLGCFDEHGIFPFNVAPSHLGLLAFTTGWTRRVSVPVDAAIGLASSADDGLTFRKHGLGPVLAPSLREPFLVGDAFVREIDGLLHMWYIHGVRWLAAGDGAPPERVYKIAHATSRDAVNWQRENRQIICDTIGADECQALPTVALIGGLYRMLFCFREATGFRETDARGYRLGYAYSHDLRNWTRADHLFRFETSGDSWDAGMQCYPHLLTMHGKHFLLYNGNAFGRHGFGIARLEN